MTSGAILQVKSFSLVVNGYSRRPALAFYFLDVIDLGRVAVGTARERRAATTDLLLHAGDVLAIKAEARAGTECEQSERGVLHRQIPRW